MRRRAFLGWVGGAIACSGSAAAQHTGQVRRIGVLLPGSPDGDYGEYFSAFLKGLEDLGYINGRNCIIEVRWGEGLTTRLPSLAADLVKQHVDVLVVSSSLAANAALKATSNIPVVQASGASPVGTGAAESLSRPHRNLTGFTNQSEDVSGKLLELLLMAVPGMARAGVLMDPNAPVTEPQMKQLQGAAQALSVSIHPVGVSKPNDLENAFAELSREKVTGLVVFSAALLVSESRKIVELARAAKLPAIYPFLNFAAHGGLMAYGVDHREQFRRSAILVDRILKGAHPRDFPVEQPTRFYLHLNLKTASEFGISIPPTLLARADEVIE